MASPSAPLPEIVTAAISVSSIWLSASVMTGASGLPKSAGMVRLASDETLPAASVCVAVTAVSPSVRRPSSATTATPSASVVTVCAVPPMLTLISVFASPVTVSVALAASALFTTPSAPASVSTRPGAPGAVASISRGVVVVTGVTPSVTVASMM